MNERPEEEGVIEPDWDEQLRCRHGFDWLAECGVFMCLECGSAWYPMELREGWCPECFHDELGNVIRVPAEVCKDMHAHQTAKEDQQ